MDVSILCMAATLQRKRKEKKQLNFRYLQSENKRYLQTRTLTCTQSTRTVTQQSPF